jgi:hypothetical protein
MYRGNTTTLVDSRVQGQHSNSCRQTDTYLTKAFAEQTCPGAAKSVENQTRPLIVQGQQ